MPTHLVWFRTDLRLHDNLALAAACRHPKAKIIALVYRHAEAVGQHEMAPRQAAFLQAHLNALQSQLALKNIPLIFREVEDFAASVDEVKKVCDEHQVSQLFYNYQYEINERKRDALLEKTLDTVMCQGFDDSVMLAPGSVITGNHQMYKVFTPFKNAYLRRLKEGLPECVAAPAPRDGEVGKQADIALHYPQVPFDTSLFAADEKQAIARLRHFCQQQAAEYEEKKRFPGHRRHQPLIGMPDARRALASTMSASPSDRVSTGAGRWAWCCVAERAYLAGVLPPPDDVPP